MNVPETCLFINGIYESVLEELITAQSLTEDGRGFLQPHKGQIIAMLKKQPPSVRAPMKLFASTTTNLSQVCYVADIVGWEDKRELDDAHRADISRLIQEYQPSELELFDKVEAAGVTAVNLLTVKNLRKLDTFYATSLLVKISDNAPLKKRTRAGGWSAVYDPGDVIELEPKTAQSHFEEFEQKLAESKAVSTERLDARLSKAPKKPAKVQLISVGFTRNPDVVARVLQRANGVCERCEKKAPFIRAKDKTPYLEVHHKKMLSDGGEDTVQNAQALCPNCHRELHFGLGE